MDGLVHARSPNVFRADLGIRVAYKVLRCDRTKSASQQQQVKNLLASRVASRHENTAVKPRPGLWLELFEITEGQFDCK